VAEGARLESVFRGNSNVGSNPTLSASIHSKGLKGVRPSGYRFGYVLTGSIIAVLSPSSVLSRKGHTDEGQPIRQGTFHSQVPQS
jgi:hypothetical protein